MSRRQRRAFLERLRREQLTADWPAERRVAAFLEKHGVRFERQVVFLFKKHPTRVGAVVDFYLPQHRVVLEVDGLSHRGDEAAAYDRERDELLLGRGDVVRVVRLDNGWGKTRLEVELSCFFPAEVKEQPKPAAKPKTEPTTKAKKRPKVRARTRYLLDQEAVAANRARARQEQADERWRQRLAWRAAERERLRPVTRSVLCRKPT